MLWRRKGVELEVVESPRARNKVTGKEPVVRLPRRGFETSKNGAGVN